MLKKQMTREVMLDALEHDYNDLMNLGDLYGARAVEAAINTLRLYEKSSSSPAPRPPTTVRKASTNHNFRNTIEGTITENRPLDCVCRKPLSRFLTR